MISPIPPLPRLGVWWLGFFACAFLFLTFQTNLFKVRGGPYEVPSGLSTGTATAEVKAEYQADSDSLPLNVLYGKAIEGHESPGGFNLWSDSNYGLPFYRYFPDGHTHVSHYALETRVYSAFSPWNKDAVPGFVDHTRTILRLLLAMVLALFIVAVARETSWWIGLVLTFLLSVTSGIVLISGNLFWATFTFQAPISLVWFFYPLARSCIQQILLGIMVLLLLVVRYLCSWEYSSVIGAMIGVVVFYYELKAASSWRRIMGGTMICGAICVAAFVISYAINAAAVAKLAKTQPDLVGTVSRRIWDMASFTQASTSEIDDWQKHRPAIYAKLKASGFDTWRGTFPDRLAYAIRNSGRSLLWPAVAIPFTGRSIPLGVAIPFMLGWMIWLTRRRNSWGKSTQAWLGTTWAALGASLTWPLLMSGHFQSDYHLTPVFLSFSWLPVFYILLMVSWGEMAAGRQAGQV